MDRGNRYQRIYERFPKSCYQVGYSEGLRDFFPSAMVGFNSALLVEGMFNNIPVITLMLENSKLHEYFPQITVCKDMTELNQALVDLK